MGFFSVFTLLVGITTISITLLLTKDLQWTGLSLENTANSTVISPQILGSIRVFMFVAALGIGLYIYFDHPITLTVTVRDGLTKKVSIKNGDRFAAFTLWCWSLQIIYFGLATSCSIDFLFMKSNISHPLLCLTWVIYEIAFSTAYLVTVVVTFVLIPGGKAKGIPVDVFFKTSALCVHNLNIVFILIESLTNQLHFNFWHFPFVLLFGCAYVLFSWIWYSTKGYLFYFFLDYDRKYAELWHLGLIFAVLLFFFVGYYISELKDYKDPMVYSIIILVSMFILKFRE
eukprot:gene1985-3862_t